MEQLTSKIPLMVIEGNHEIEPQIGGITFSSYRARFAVPAQESYSNSSFYYSFNAGGVHFIMLGCYVDYNQTGAQYTWLKEDLLKVDRDETPWVVAAWHSPWYNSYSSHYQEFECMRQENEGLLYQYHVDIIFSGHVHAYERMNRVYNYTLDSCGPVYITVGDGGNIEQIDVDHADDPGKCPSQNDNIPEFGGVCHINFSSGSAKGKFCWDQQPEWSAFRESSFGHGILEEAPVKLGVRRLPIRLFVNVILFQLLRSPPGPIFSYALNIINNSGWNLISSSESDQFNIRVVDMASKSRHIQRKQQGRSDLYCEAARVVLAKPEEGFLKECVSQVFGCAQTERREAAEEKWCTLDRSS
ncbi:Purple acid phosphatase 15 [Platanthera guangdongensis]|uniref:Purple acid phosphatase 15 n=1 Tax=Platanthera guangdongensis TaxID=2320717 RepID=A0ABR2MK65_9ASPA